VKVGEKIYISRTLSCQDIDAYAKRDTEKSRDMVVGMMPPKLCQMMINIAGNNGKQGIYDPFCGLGTFLIEGANMGITPIYGSDISARMVEASKTSIDNFIKEEIVWQDRIRKV
jgi:tRNA G10  N-methylase Trm11